MKSLYLNIFSNIFLILNILYIISFKFQFFLNRKLNYYKIFHNLFKFRYALFLFTKTKFEFEFYSKLYTYKTFEI